MRFFINIIAVILIGLLLGGLTANLALQRSHGIGAVNTGSWSAWPFVGGAEIDPYTSAKATADGTLPLGVAEGLAFEALEDQKGNSLLRECNYEVSGNTSATRLWTLAAYDLEGRLVLEDETVTSSLYSGNVTRYPDASFRLKLSAIPQSGNWLPIHGKGNFKLILRLYDTPITNNTGVIDPQMPRIQLIGCDQ